MKGDGSMKLIKTEFVEGIVSYDCYVTFEDDDGQVLVASVRDLGEEMTCLVADRPWTNSSARDMVTVDTPEDLEEAARSRYYPMYRKAIAEIGLRRAELGKL